MSIVLTSHGSSPPGKDALSRMLAMEKLSQARRAYSSPASMVKPNPNVHLVQTSKPEPPPKNPARATGLRVSTVMPAKSVTPAEPVNSHSGTSSSEDSGTGTENESPSSSICHSPTWSDHGGKARKKEKMAAKELKELEKKSKAQNSREAKPRTNKKPPPAAMDTQRMPAALEQSLRSESNVKAPDSWKNRRRSSITSLASALRFPALFPGQTDNVNRSEEYNEANGTITENTSGLQSPPQLQRPRSIALRSQSLDAVPGQDFGTALDGSILYANPTPSVAADESCAIQVGSSPQPSPPLATTQRRYSGLRDNTKGGYQYPQIGNSPPASRVRSRTHSRSNSDASADPPRDYFSSNLATVAENSYVNKQRMQQRERSVESYREEVLLSSIVQESIMNEALEALETSSRASYASSTSVYFEAPSFCMPEDNTENHVVTGSTSHTEYGSDARAMELERYLASGSEPSDVSLRLSYLNHNTHPLPQAQSKPQLTRLRKRGGQVITSRGRVEQDASNTAERTASSDTSQDSMSDSSDQKVLVKDSQYYRRPPVLLPFAEKAGMRVSSAFPSPISVESSSDSSDIDKCTSKMTLNHSKSDPELQFWLKCDAATARGFPQNSTRQHVRFASDTSPQSKRKRPSNPRSSTVPLASQPFPESDGSSPQSATSSPLPLRPWSSSAPASPQLGSQVTKRTNRSSLTPTRSRASRQSFDAKPIAKMFVICCKCRHWHDLPSNVYRALVQPQGMEMENRSSKQIRGATSECSQPGLVVTCPWCRHGMSSGCCAGWTTLLYLHERHH